MTPQELKNSILQMAIQGKLVEQRPEEGTAEELYQQIQEEKQRLIKEGKIKKEMPLPDIAEDEKPFEIPESWKWVRIGQIFNLQAGKSITSSDIYEAKSPEHQYLCYGGNGIRGYVSSYNREGHFALIGRQGALCGNINIADGRFYATEHAVVVDHYNLTDVIWGSWFLEAINLNQYATATAQPGLAVANIVKVLIPLPPLAEQKRIVAKIEKLLPYIDRYEQAWGRLEDFNKRFPDDMKKSIFQLAIQGKLVEQRPEEGTAEELYQQIQAEKQRLIKTGKLKKERPLPEITEDEKPFDIPESWKWVRLNNISYMIGDIDHRMPPTVESGGFPYISPLNFTDDGDIDYDGAKKISEEDFERLSQKCIPSRNDIIFPRYGTIGVVRLVKTDRKFLVSYSCCTIKNIPNLMYPKYVFYILQSKVIRDEINRYINKTTQPNVGLQSIKQFIFPLPPLAEQKRIVAKLEDLLPLCDMLKRG